jgi:uncharacterized membrane protein
VPIYFIHHVASSIRAERVIDGVARELERGVDRLFPDAERRLAGRAGTSSSKWQCAPCRPA